MSDSRIRSQWLFKFGQESVGVALIDVIWHIYFPLQRVLTSMKQQIFGRVRESAQFDEVENLGKTDCSDAALFRELRDNLIRQIGT